MTFRSVATAQETGYDSGGRVATAGSITIARPAGTVAGDILVAVIAVDTASADTSTGIVTTAPTGWTTVVNSTSLFQHIYWKVAGSSEASSYTFSFFDNFSNPKHAFANAVIGCWTDWASPVLKTFSSSANRFKTDFSFNTSFPTPNVPDIASTTLNGAETTTGGIQIVTWLAFETIENFQGSVIWSGGNPAYPASIPYVTTTVSAPQVEHAQLHYEGLPTYNGGEDVTTTMADNKMLTVASHDVTAGSLPSVSASFTWQHAGDEAGFGEQVEVIRLVIEATAARVAYWGILVKPV